MTTAMPSHLARWAASSSRASSTPCCRSSATESATAPAFAERPCACGDPFPALVRIEGRKLDWIIDDTGARGSAATTLVLECHRSR